MNEAIVIYCLLFLNDRNQHNADLVTMIMDTLRLSSDPVCGIAWIGTCCLFNDAYGFSINDVACTNYEYTPAHGKCVLCNSCVASYGAGTFTTDSFICFLL